MSFEEDIRVEGGRGLNDCELPLAQNSSLTVFTKARLLTVLSLGLGCTESLLVSFNCCFDYIKLAYYESIRLMTEWFPGISWVTGPTNSELVTVMKFPFLKFYLGFKQSHGDVPLLTAVCIRKDRRFIWSFVDTLNGIDNYFEGLISLMGRLKNYDPKSWRRLCKLCIENMADLNIGFACEHYLCVPGLIDFQLHAFRERNLVFGQYFADEPSPVNSYYANELDYVLRVDDFLDGIRIQRLEFRGTYNWTSGVSIEKIAQVLSDMMKFRPRTFQDVCKCDSENIFKWEDEELYPVRIELLDGTLTVVD